MRTRHPFISLFAGFVILAVMAATFGVISPAAADPVIVAEPPLIGHPVDMGFHTPSTDAILGEFTPTADPSGRTPEATGDLASRAPGAAAGPVGATDLNAGLGCSVQCITSGVAYARGVGAELVVKTVTPARIWILVWNDDGYVSLVDSGSKTREFGHHFDDLEAGTQYYALASAEDALGVAQADGTFETLSRHVEIHMDAAVLSEHAFDNSTFTKDVWVEGGWLEGHSAYSLLDYRGVLGWEADEIFMADVDQHLDLAVQLEEHDEDPDLCQGTVLPAAPSFGGVLCNYWAFASLDDGDADLDARPSDATSWTEHTLERTLRLPSGALPPGYGTPLDFIVEVLLHVVYS